MLPSMMSARPVFTLSTVADHSISDGFASRPSFCAIVAIISPSVPISLPSLTLVIGMSPLIATVSTPGVTVLKLGAAKPERLRSPASAMPPKAAPATKDLRLMIFCILRPQRVAP